MLSLMIVLLVLAASMPGATNRGIASASELPSSIDTVPDFSAFIRAWNKTVTYYRYDRVNSLSISPDGSKVVVAVDWKQAYMYSTADGWWLDKFIGHSGDINSVAFNPKDPNRFVTGSDDHTCRVWTLSGKSNITLVGHNTNVTRVAWSPDGTMVASASGGQDIDIGGGKYEATVRLWNPTTGVELRQFNISMPSQTPKMYYVNVTALAFSPDNKYIAAGTDTNYYDPADKCVLMIWEVATGTLVKRTERTFYINALSFSPDGRYLAMGTASNAGYLIIYNATTFSDSTARIVSPSGGLSTVRSLAWHPAAPSVLASGTKGGRLKLWDVEGNLNVPVKELLAPGASVAHPYTPASDARVSTCGWLPNGTRLLSGGYCDRTIASWGDATPPVVQSVYPMNGATNFPTSGKVTVTFSKRMERASTQNAFSLQTQGTNVQGTPSWSDDSRTLNFTPTGGLSLNSVYWINVSTSARDSSDNRLANPWSTSFATASVFTGSIQGVVKEQGTLTPIPAATITVVQGSTQVWVASSGGSGSFYIATLSYGSYSLKFNHKDYNELTQTVSVSSASQDLGEVLLTRKTTQPPPPSDNMLLIIVLVAVIGAVVALLVAFLVLRARHSAERAATQPIPPAKAPPAKMAAPAAFPPPPAGHVPTFPPPPTAGAPQDARPDPTRKKPWER